MIGFFQSLPATQPTVRCRLAILGLCSFYLTSLILVACGCSKKISYESAEPALLPEVPVTTAVQSNVPVTLQVIGHASPCSSIAIRSQVSGILESVHFKEGGIVKAGELLFTIDRQPFADALAQAKSNLERDVGLQVQAISEREENAVLLKSSIVSRDNYNESAAYAESLKAAVAADKALVDSAERELSYCQIRSPIDGRTGFLQVSPGNMVQIGEMVLVTINQMQPIYVDFPISEQDLPTVRDSAVRGRLQVQVISLHEQKDWTGELIAIDNTVEPNTRTVLLRARFPNDKEALWPGQSVKVLLSLQTLTNAALISREAVQKGPGGEFVFVVNPDSTIESRHIETCSQVGNNMIICRGLNTGERVVTKPQAGLAPGTQVRYFETAHTGP